MDLVSLSVTSNSSHETPETELCCQIFRHIPNSNKITFAMTLGEGGNNAAKLFQHREVKIDEQTMGKELT